MRKAPAKAYQEKNKEEHFHVPDFAVGKKILTSFRDQQQSKCHFAALTSETTGPQFLDVIAIADLLAKSKSDKKRMLGKFDKKDL